VEHVSTNIKTKKLLMKLSKSSWTIKQKKKNFLPLILRRVQITKNRRSQIHIEAILRTLSLFPGPLNQRKRIKMT